MRYTSEEIRDSLVRIYNFAATNANLHGEGELVIPHLQVPDTRPPNSLLLFLNNWSKFLKNNISKNVRIKPVVSGKIPHKLVFQYIAHILNSTLKEKMPVANDYNTIVNLVEKSKNIEHTRVVLAVRVLLYEPDAESILSILTGGINTRKITENSPITQNLLTSPTILALGKIGRLFIDFIVQFNKKSTYTFGSERSYLILREFLAHFLTTHNLPGQMQYKPEKIRESLQRIYSFVKYPEYISYEVECVPFLNARINLPESLIDFLDYKEHDQITILEVNNGQIPYELVYKYIIYILNDHLHQKIPVANDDNTMIHLIQESKRIENTLIVQAVRILLNPFTKETLNVLMSGQNIQKVRMRNDTTDYLLHHSVPIRLLGDVGQVFVHFLTQFNKKDYSFLSYEDYSAIVLREFLAYLFRGE